MAAEKPARRKRRSQPEKTTAFPPASPVIPGAAIPKRALAQRFDPAPEPSGEPPGRP